MAGNGSISQGALLVFDEKGFNDWKIKMLAIFGFPDVADMVMNGVEDPGSKAIEETKKQFKNLQKLDIKAKFLIYQCVGPKIF